jgi:iron-sulfur cluster assembly accessory protein
MTQSENTAGITITPAARAHIRNQLTQTQAGYLRLGVKESGCNGYMYMLDFLESPQPEDQCFDFGDEVLVCVSADAIGMVEGTEVDMLTEGLNSALVFKNPNATSYCGCGESFAVQDAADTQDTAADDAQDLATNVGPN